MAQVYPDCSRIYRVSFGTFACFLFFCCAFLCPSQIRAQDRAFGPTPSAAGAVAYFANLKDGDKVPEKFLVRFGIEKMTVAPASSSAPNSGHHHLLIDSELPPFNKPIPNDFKHLHFGRGQTETTVTLPPGEHTLQLLFADHDHIPHNPPVVSDRIKVTVVKDMPAQKTAASPAPAAPTSSASAKTAEPAPTSHQRQQSPPEARVYIASPVNGAVVPPTVTVRFGLKGMGVAPAGVVKAKTGHHHLLIDTPLPPLDKPVPNDFNHIHYGLGQTEAEVKLSLGPHTLQLLLADDAHVPHDPAIYSPVVRVLVTATGKVRARQPRRLYRHPRFAR